MEYMLYSGGVWMMVLIRFMVKKNGASEGNIDFG